MFIIEGVLMVDVTGEFSLAQEFSACEDLGHDIGIVEAFNNGTAYGPGLSDTAGLIIEEEMAGVMIIPLDNIARMHAEGLVDLDPLFEAVPELEERVDGLSKGLPYCGPDLIGQVSTPTTPFA